LEAKINNKRPKEENQSSLMPEGGDPKRIRETRSKLDNPETLALSTIGTQTSRSRKTKKKKNIEKKKHKQKN